MITSKGKRELMLRDGSLWNAFCFVCGAVSLSFCCVWWVLSGTVISSMGKRELVLCDGSLWNVFVIPPAYEVCNGGI